MAERKYVTPDFSTSTTPTSTLAAANPVKKEVEGEVVISTPSASSTSIAPEAKMVPDSAPQRKYVNPVFTPEVETSYKDIEPKDINQAAASARLPGQQMAGGVSGNLDKEVEDAFKWTPTLATSGVGSAFMDSSSRAFGPALKDYMASMGVSETKDILKPKYDAAYSKVMEGHGAPVYPVTPTLENIQKYNQDYADYIARAQSAKAAGLEAINQEKATLSDKAAKWADNIAKENEKIIGSNGEMLFDSTKRGVANSILNNKLQISAVNENLNKATTLPEIMAQIPSLAYAAGVARNPEAQPTEFAIQETKGIVDAMDPMASNDAKKLAFEAFLPWVLAKLTGRDPGPSPLTLIADKAEYNNPSLIKTRMTKYMNEVAQMNNASQSRYIKGSKEITLPPPEVVKPLSVSDADFSNPAFPQKDKIVLDSIMRWNKMTSLSPEEAKLGIKDPNKTATGENEGVAAFQSFLKTKLGANNLKVTGIPNEEDMAALKILIKQNPSMSAKDIIKESLEHKADLDTGTTNTEKPKGTGGKSGGKVETAAEKAKRLGLL